MRWREKGGGKEGRERGEKLYFKPVER